MSEDKVRTKDLCWSVGTIYDSRELPGVNTAGPGIGRGVTPEYLVMVVGAQNRVGNGARRMAQMKTRGPGGSGEGLRSSSLS
jgi:hypothetical protein